MKKENSLWKMKLDFTGFPDDSYNKIPYSGMIFNNPADNKTYKFVPYTKIKDPYLPHHWVEIK